MSGENLQKSSNDAPVSQARVVGHQPTNRKPGYLTQPITLAALGTVLANAPEVARLFRDRELHLDDDDVRRIRRRSLIGAGIGAVAGIPAGMYARHRWKQTQASVKEAQVRGVSPENEHLISPALRELQSRPPDPAQVAAREEYDRMRTEEHRARLARREAARRERLQAIGQNIANTERDYNRYFRNPFLHAMAYASGAGPMANSFSKARALWKARSVAPHLPGWARSVAPHLPAWASRAQPALNAAGTGVSRLGATLHGALGLSKPLFTHEAIKSLNEFADPERIQATNERWRNYYATTKDPRLPQHSRHNMARRAGQFGGLALEHGTPLARSYLFSGAPGLSRLGSGLMSRQTKRLPQAASSVRNIANFSAGIPGRVIDYTTMFRPDAIPGNYGDGAIKRQLGQAYPGQITREGVRSGLSTRERDNYMFRWEDVRPAAQQVYDYQQRNMLPPPSPQARNTGAK